MALIEGRMTECPDNQDYQALYALLASPPSHGRMRRPRPGVDADGTQADSIASWQPQDRKRIDAMTVVLGDIDAAIARWKAAR